MSLTVHLLCSGSAVSIVTVFISVSDVISFRLQKKCDHYWPEDQVQTFHGINVELLNTSDLPDFTTRTFKLTKVCHMITAHNYTYRHFQRHR